MDAIDHVLLVYVSRRPYRALMIALAILNISMALYNLPMLINFKELAFNPIKSKETIVEDDHRVEMFYEAERFAAQYEPSCDDEEDHAFNEWHEYAGSVDLEEGTSLQRGDNGQVVLLTYIDEHFSRDTIGFIMNNPLNPDEDLKARKSLREIDNESSESRGQILKDVLIDPTRVWLGQGGKQRDIGESWIHFHNCSHIENVSVLGTSLVFVGGDLFQALLDKNCFIKLVYGFTSWVPGQLEAEIQANIWNLIL